MKKILIIIAFSLFLLSCSEEEIIEDAKKQDFFVETKSVIDFWDSLYLKKTWKLTSSQDINLSSQASWRISNIYVKEWDYVKIWDIISRLSDSVANYWFALERAKNTLNKANINYDTSESSLNKRISDIEIGLSNLKVDESNSKSSLELEKIDNSIKKIALDYDNLKIANYQSIIWFKNSMWKDLTSFITYIDDVIDFSDRILWVTTKNKDENDSFEDYLWAENSAQLKESENLLLALINYRNNELAGVNFNFEWSSLFDSNISVISNGYSKINIFLKSLDSTFDNSISSLGSLSEADISWYKNSINWHQWTYNLNNAWFISLKNWISSFLDTFRNTEASLLKQIELLESDKIYVKSLDISLELDQSTLNEAISNKDLTLRQLSAGITDANISYKQALDNYNKLIIRSPINGTIGSIFSDVWQEVWPWTILFNISNNASNEISVAFSKKELGFIKSWDTALINFNNEVFTWSIYSISGVADSNLKYLSKIAFPEWSNIIWDIVNVDIAFSTWKNVLPINLIKIDNSWRWIINVFSWWIIEQKNIELWDIYNDQIEVLTKLNNDLKIVTNYVDNFDEEKFILKIK